MGNDLVEKNLESSALRKDSLVVKNVTSCSLEVSANTMKSAVSAYLQ